MLKPRIHEPEGADVHGWQRLVRDRWERIPGRVIVFGMMLILAAVAAWLGGLFVLG